MPEAEFTDSFVMHGARSAAANGMPHINAQIAALERAVVENPSLVFDLAKYIVESACRTILSERKIGFDRNDALPKLFKAVTTNVPMLPKEASAESEARRKLLQTLNGLHTALQGVCELRNTCGFTSHGGEAQAPVMEGVQAVLAAQAADTIVGFLFSAHRVQRVGLPQNPTGHNLTVDALLDTLYEPVSIAGEPYMVSEVLYAIDREAYLAILATVEESRNVIVDMGRQYQGLLKPELREISFVHYSNVVYLKTSNEKREIILEDTSFVSGGDDGLFFSPSRSPEENADLLTHRFDPYSIITCFSLFTNEAAEKIAQAYEAGTLDSLFPPRAIVGGNQ